MSPLNLFDIRSFDGSQHRAWEELAYQLRDEPPASVVEVRKTRAPDGGVEWYYVFEDGHQEGFQAKFYRSLSAALGDMKQSAATVAANRPAMTDLTFVLPFDLTDHATAKYESDQDRWDKSTAAWSTDIASANRLSFHLIRGGDVLERLALERHAGRRAFWFGEVEVSRDWFKRQQIEAEQIVGRRYTPEAHTPLAIQGDIEALALSPQFEDELRGMLEATRDELLDWLPPTNLRDQVAGYAERLRDGLTKATHDPFGLSTNDLEAHALELLDRLDLHLDDLEPGADDYDLHRTLKIRTAADSLARFLRTPRVASATSRTLGVHGISGQGKTHLFLSSANRLLDDGAGAIVLLGDRFSSAGWWESVKAQLGLPDISRDVFVGALSAFAEASGRRVVLFLDALNESQDPRMWRSELPSLVQTLSRIPTVALVVSWRTDYAQVLFSDGKPTLPTVRHPGLLGAESEALTKYCQLYGLPEPAISALEPAFLNPLFLHLYCEIRAADPSIGEGSLSRSRVFTEFVRLRAAAVRDRLRLAPTSSVPEESIALVADQLVGTGGLPIARSEIEPAIDALAPNRTEWPDTLFGALVSAGLLELMPGPDAGEVVGFPFQAFSDHLVVSRMLDSVDPTLDWAESFSTALKGSARLWFAAAVLLPEARGIELEDLLESDELFAWTLKRATLQSLVDRRTDAFGARARELLAAALNQEELVSEALSVVLQLAPRLNHPANALWLHELLRSMPMPDRDAWWSISTFDLLEESDAFERLVDWAARGGDSVTPSDQVLLAAIPLMWVLTSPNRVLRDHSTKALVQLLMSRMDLVPRLLRMSRGIDDVYLVERILTVSYGCLMRRGNSALTDSATVAEEVLTWFEDGTMPVHVLARDAGRGVIAWASSHGLLARQADIADPPYGSAPPEEPPSAEHLKSSYGHVPETDESRCAAILSSCLDWMGDFNKYVAGPDVGEFSWHPLTGPPPTSADRYGESQVKADWAGRWIASKAIGKGWTEERFGNFERSRNLHNGRSAHKPERFGKKYQWQALHELLARLADNFHALPGPNDIHLNYQGPWRWFGRDIDPSLVVSTRNGSHLEVPVGLAGGANPWTLQKPDLDSPASTIEWASAGLPQRDAVVGAADMHGAYWVALYRYSTWTRRAEGGGRWDTDRRQWILLFSWLTKPGDGDRLLQMLSEESLFGRWMPEGRKPNRAYLGEGPWSPIETAEPAEWDLASRRYRDPVKIPVLPATAGYLWEAVTQDCSLDETVNLEMPAADLLQDSTWDGTQPEWSSNGEVVIRSSRTPESVPGDDHVLVARADWLETRLRDLGLELVLGYLGERQGSNSKTDDLKAWTEVSGAALWLPPDEWAYTDQLVDTHTSDDQSDQ